jgi:AcrR family transcriptional regulator
MDAFWSLYRTKRIEKISIKEITDKAGYNRGTFYEYFKDVYDVLEQIENELLVKLKQQIPLPLPPSSEPALNPSVPLSMLIRLFEEQGDYFVVLLGDQGDSAFLSKIKNSFKPYLLAMLPEEARNSGFQLDYTIEYALNAMIGIFSYWFSQEDRPPLEELFLFMNELANEGVMKKFYALQ